MQQNNVEPSYADLELGLQIDQDALDECIQTHSDLFQRVQKACILAESRRDLAKEQLELEEASADERIRSLAYQHDEKITEREVRSQIVLDGKVRAARNKLLQLSREANEWSALKESYRQRSYMLRSMVDLYAAGYWGDSMPERSSEVLKTARANMAKKQMNDMRRER